MSAAVIAMMICAAACGNNQSKKAAEAEAEAAVEEATEVVLTEIFRAVQNGFTQTELDRREDHTPEIERLEKELAAIDAKLL